MTPWRARRNAFQQPLDERRRRPEDVDDDDVVEPLTRSPHGLGQRRLYLDVFGFHPTVDNLSTTADAAQADESLAEGDLFRLDVAQRRELVSREGVRDDWRRRLCPRLSLAIGCPQRLNDVGLPRVGLVCV